MRSIEILFRDFPKLRCSIAVDIAPALLLGVYYEQARPYHWYELSLWLGPLCLSIMPYAGE